MPSRPGYVFGLPLEAAMLILLVFASLVWRRCLELENDAREACAGHRCPAEGLEPMLIDGKCICMERSR